MFWVPNFVLSQDISPCLSPAVSEDSGDAVAALLSELGETFDSESSFDWQLVRPYGLLNHCVRPTRAVSSCGKLLAHARAQITAFRKSVGVRVCVFKLGVTSNPIKRYADYIGKGYDRMWLISVSQSADTIQMLEAACIALFSSHVGCRNKPESGGEGALNRATPPKPPFYLYVVGCRADQFRAVG